jgi:hypothetical protein
MVFGVDAVNSLLTALRARTLVELWFDVILFRLQRFRLKGFVIIIVFWYVFPI